MFTIIIKTIEFENFKIVLKRNNKLYMFNKNDIIENKLLIYDPKQNDKLLNIINIYDRYWDLSFMILSNNRIFIFWIDLEIIIYKNIYESILNFEINDIIENVICTNDFDFIIIKNINIFKIFICNNHLQKPKLIKSLNYNIIDIKETGKKHKFIYLDQINKQQFIEMTNYELKKILFS